MFLFITFWRVSIQQLVHLSLKEATPINLSKFAFNLRYYLNFFVNNFGRLGLFGIFWFNLQTILGNSRTSLRLELGGFIIGKLFLSLHHLLQARIWIHFLISIIDYFYLIFGWINSYWTLNLIKFKIIKIWAFKLTNNYL